MPRFKSYGFKPLVRYAIKVYAFYILKDVIYVVAGFRLAIESMNQRLSALEERQSSLEAELRDILYEEETSPAVSFVNQTLIKAINLGASDIEKLAEKLKELIVGELKEEFRDFKATVSGELAGFPHGPSLHPHLL